MERSNEAMQLSLVGLSHRSAPIELREYLAVGAGALADALAKLKSDPDVDEAVIISTCNRIEILTAGATAESAEAAAYAFLAERAPKGLCVHKHLYRLRGEDAAQHLFRVAASLDSLVVGEPQILGQVKQAFQSAREAGTVGPRLRRLFDKTFSIAKRVRSHTRIGQESLSVASLAIEALVQALGSLEGRSILIIGTGKMGEQALQRLRKLGAPALFVANRTLEHACDEARKHSAQAVELGAIAGLLDQVDAVISSTAAPHFILTQAEVARAMERRGGRPLHLVDLALPRDIDPAVASLPGAVLWDVDGLQEAASRSRSRRHSEAEQAEQMVRAEAAHWFAAQDARQPQFAACCQG